VDAVRNSSHQPVAKNGVIAFQFCALALKPGNVEPIPVNNSENLFVCLFIVYFWLVKRLLHCCTQARISVCTPSETR